MNSVEKEAVLHCLKSMIDEEVCEECPLYGTTGTDHCEKDCVRLAINALEQEPCDDCIRREDALMALTGEWTEPTDEIIHRFIRRIKSLPPVNPQDPKLLQALEQEKGAYNALVKNIQSLDCISRQAVLEELPRRTMKNYFGEVVGDVVYIDDIKALPSVTPQPKTDILDKIKGYIDHISTTGLGKKKSLEFIGKFIDGLKAEGNEKE